MANQITTAQDLQDVLDAIYNNREQFDTYQNLTLYYNDITRTATIFAVNEEDAEVPTQDVIAVFNPENVVTTNNAFFVTLMKSATVNVSTEETSVYDFALGGYVNVDTLLKNICVALGVSLSGTFADANPTLYSDMVNIIRNEYGQSLENNAPYIMKKFVNVSTQDATYKSLVPLMCIVRIAIYLNSIGIFVSGDYKVLGNVTPYSTCLLNGYLYNDSYNEMQIDFPTWADFDVSVMDKETFIDTFKKFFTQPRMVVSNENALITNGLNAFDIFLAQYENEIDWNNYIYGRWTQTTSSATNTETVALFVYNLNDVFLNFSDNAGIANFQTANYGKRSIKNNNTVYTRYMLTVSHNNSTQEDTITHNKDVYTINKGFSDIGDNVNVHNLKGDRRVKPYVSPFSGDWFTVGSSRKFKPIDNYPQLSRNTAYNNLKYLTDEKDFIPYNLRKILEKENVELNIGENDYVLLLNRSYGSYGRKHVIIKIKDTNKGITFGNNIAIANPTGAMFSINCNFMPVPDIQLLESGVWNEYNASELTWYQDVTTFRSNQSSIMSQKFTIAENTDVEVYTIDINRVNNAYTYTYSYDLINTNEFKIYEYLTDGTYTVLSNNLGEMVEIGESSSIEGATLIEGATYPNNVIDLNSFNTTYPDWFKTQSNNPQIVNGVLAPTVTSTQWGAISISRTAPTTQEDADGGDIDFTNPEEVQDIIDDTEKATEDEDTPTGDAQPDNDDSVTGENEGATPLPPSATDIVPIMGARVFALTAADMQTFLSNCMEGSAWTAIAGLDPLKYIISVQGTQSVNYADITSEPKAYKLGDTEVYFAGKALSGTQLFAEYNFGQAYISPEYMNYNDVTSTTLSVYLPCVGYVDLDITDFLDRMMVLHATVDLTNGNIMYYIGVNELGGDISTLQYIYQFNGNCHRNIPVSSETSVLIGLKNSISGLLGGVQ